MLSEGVTEDLVPLNSENESTFFHSLSVSAPDILEWQSGGPKQNVLEIGADVDDALYYDDVNDVACIIIIIISIQLQSGSTAMVMSLQIEWKNVKQSQLKSSPVH